VRLAFHFTPVARPRDHGDGQSWHWRGSQSIAVYGLRYARLYYSPPHGGIAFHGEGPDYIDVAYLGLTIGMTFQVSDTELTRKRVRRGALHHALLSYGLGIVIVAITVDSVAGLLGH
jgi:uncharacterized membrane protein